MTLLENAWAVMPLPCLIVGPDDRIKAINSAAESFLSSSQRKLSQKSLADLFGDTSRILEVVARARVRKVDAADHNIEFLWPRRPLEMIDIIAAASEGEDDILLVLQPRSIAEQIDRSLTHRHAARSMVGFGAMLSHEIKNPLAGISGAA
ncbi:MAG: two-component sensor histidine kinase, partial [Pseudomonadota bacterium]